MTSSQNANQVNSKGLEIYSMSLPLICFQFFRTTKISVELDLIRGFWFSRHIYRDREFHDRGFRDHAQTLFRGQMQPYP